MEVEQLLSLSGPALAQAISSLLETPGLYVFSDILELPNVREVTHTLTCKHTHKQAHRHSHSQGTALTGGGIARDHNKPPLSVPPHLLLYPKLETGPHAPVYQLLNLFAYGTYCDYKERAASLPELTPAQRNKLRHLSIISLASNLKCLPYSLLLQQLELKNVRELEDLLIEAVYCDIIQGKLDQRNQQVEVDCSVGRDLGPNELPNIANTLQEWCSGCEAVLCGIEEQVTRANQYRESQLKVKVQVETEVSNLQKTLKASSASPSSGPAAAGAASNQDADQPAEPRDPASSQEPRQPGKKSSKVKGLRGSGKIWSKSN
uniref:COP9 constitutive photomorphogenic homolog subunit 7A n=1 Tax=Salmo trutta TaxID=8032 RepID=A0A673W0M6_SALTR